MERRIEIRSGIRDHLYFADLELRARGVTFARSFAAEIIANGRRGQAFVSYHAVLDDMAEVDKHAVRHPGEGVSPNQMKQEAR